jgi:hypothetical protein
LERRHKKTLIELSAETILLAQDESRFVSESNGITSWSEKGVGISYSGYRYGTALNCFGSYNLLLQQLSILKLLGSITALSQ